METAEMPERLRVKEMLFGDVTGKMWSYDGETLRGDNKKLADALDGMYLRIVDKIDWQRIMRIAEGRCLHKKHDHTETVCGQSLRDAMCCTVWAAYNFTGEDNYSPHDVPSQAANDWAGIVAAVREAAEKPPHGLLARQRARRAA